MTFEANDMSTANITNVIAACCVLCEIHGNTFNKEWLQDVNEESSNSIAANSSSLGSGNNVRNALMEYFSQNPLYLFIPMQNMFNYTIDK